MRQVDPNLSRTAVLSAVCKRRNRGSRDRRDKRDFERAQSKREG